MFWLREITNILMGEYKKALLDKFCFNWCFFLKGITNVLMGEYKKALENICCVNRRKISLIILSWIDGRAKSTSQMTLPLGLIKFLQLSDPSGRKKTVLHILLGCFLSFPFLDLAKCQDRKVSEQFSESRDWPSRKTGRKEKSRCSPSCAACGRRRHLLLQITSLLSSPHITLC